MLSPHHVNPLLSRQTVSCPPCQNRRAQDDIKGGAKEAMKDVKTVRLAMIGCGGIARRHLQGYERIKKAEPDKVEIIAVCDPILSNAEAFADRIEGFQGGRPRIYVDYEEMLRREAGALDAADIITPHHLHDSIAVACLEAGLHVLVEKPVGVTLKATRRVAEVAQRVGKIAATAEQIRRGISQRTAWWLFKRRKLIGEPTFFYAIQLRWVPPSPPGKEPPWQWRMDKLLSGGGLILDSGVHFCDMVQVMFGRVKKVSSVVKRFLPRPVRKGEGVVMDEREDTWMAVLEFEGGVLGFWGFSACAPTHQFTHVVYYATDGALIDTGDIFHGPMGSAIVQGRDGRVRRLSDLIAAFRADVGEDEWDRLFPHGFTDGFTIECYDFLEAVQKGKRPEVTVDDYLWVKATALSVYEASVTGRTVKVQEVLEGQLEEYQRPMNEHWGLI